MIFLTIRPLYTIELSCKLTDDLNQINLVTFLVTSLLVNLLFSFLGSFIVVTTNAFRTLGKFISRTAKTSFTYDTSVTFRTLRFIMFFPVCLTAVMSVVVHVGMRSWA